MSIKKYFGVLTATLMLSSAQASDRPDLCEFERKFPTYFKGFSKTDMDLVKFSRSEDNIYKSNHKLAVKFTELQQQLGVIDNPELHNLKQEIAGFVADEKTHTLLNYIYSLVKSAILVSETNEIEENFFKFAGFSMPYSLKKEISSNSHIWETKPYHKKSLSRMLFKNFRDQEYQMEKAIKSGAFHCVPHLLLCTQPGEALLGYFYLSWTFNQGIHPIPTALKSDDEKIHGIKMTPWGKFCHDAAHLEIFPGDHIPEKFAANILNKYLEKLKTAALTPEQKKQYNIKNMIPHVTKFALSVSNAYREAMVAILERSLKHFKIAESEKLPADFKAFAVGAFLQSHEMPLDISANMASSNFIDLLNSSVKPSIYLLESKFKNSQNKNDSQESADNQPILLQIGNLFSTSIVNGESPLTDEEIFNVVKIVPLGHFEEFLHSFGSDLCIKEDEIADYKVTRNKFNIDVKIEMIDGNTYTYSEPTKYSKTQNMEHDRQFLVSAKETLAKKYQYSIPVIPGVENFGQNLAGYELAVNNCLGQTAIGTSHLLDFYLKTATELTDREDFEGQETVWDRYGMKYNKALRKLQKAMPLFIGNLQEFLSQATFKFEVQHGINLY